MKDFVEIPIKPKRHGRGEASIPPKELDLGESACTRPTGRYNPLIWDGDALGCVGRWLDEHPNLASLRQRRNSHGESEMGFYRGFGRYLYHQHANGRPDGRRFKYLFLQKISFTSSSGRGRSGADQPWPYPNSLLLMNSGSTISSEAGKFAVEMEKFVSGKITYAANSEQAAEGDAVITVTHAKDGFFSKNGLTWYGAVSHGFTKNAGMKPSSADAIVVDHVRATGSPERAGGIGQNQRVRYNGYTRRTPRKEDNISSLTTLCIPIGTRCGRGRRGRCPRAEERGSAIFMISPFDINCAIILAGRQEKIGG